MINKAIIVGRLGVAPELTVLTSGAKVCKFSVATNERWTDKNGNKQEKTQWHNIKVWGAQADACAKYLTKSKLVYIEGKIEHRQVEENGQKRTFTDIIADTVQFLGGAPNNSVIQEPLPSSEDIPF